MLEVWGRKNSSNVMPVMWTVGELDLAHIRHNVGGSFGGLDSAQFRTMNPKGLIPVIYDNGFILTESNAIVRYLCTHYGDGQLSFQAIQTQATADEWMEWYKTTVYGSYIELFKMLIRTPAEKQDMTVATEHHGTLIRHLRILDARLSKQAYVVKDKFSMADIPIGSMMYRYFNLEIERPALPHIQAWYERLCERRAFREHIMIPFGRNLDEWNALEREINKE